ncbi:MAG: ATP-binding cassette domain-containing protein, partial [Methylococcales bacterium]|nr:ATP-binding cassette domain-containing protein [Methylococcales bacterium]
MPAENIVKINRLTAHYGERKVLNQVDMAVHTGEIMAVMGGSGAGKSTLLRHMLGLRQPTSGRVHILGKDITTLPKKGLYALRKK